MRTCILCAVLSFSGILLMAQSNLKVHEWGTFTTVQNSNGLRLPGLKGEKLPPFVMALNLEQCQTCAQGRPGKTVLKNIGVQMETPVLYFYSDKEMPITVDVQFKNGIINQWYPQRSKGQSSPESAVLDMAQQGPGFIQWKATVLKPGLQLTPTPPPAELTQEWVAPRNTGANFVKGQNGEIENFLFYRGLANFETPFKVEFNNKGSLVLHNQFTQALSYVLVYDNSPGHQPAFWWSGKLASKEKKTIAQPSQDSDFQTIYDEIVHFRDELVKAGLNQDEATAMLQTWYDGYFTDVTDVKGLRVFWIAPREFVDGVLPLQISPAPDKIERVFVGRSEVLTPAFEKELTGLSVAKMESQFVDHRYLDVFKNGKEIGFPIRWTDFNSNLVTAAKDLPKTPQALMSVMPNPFSESMIVACTITEGSSLHFKLVDVQGKVIKQWVESDLPAGVFKKSYSLQDLSSGFYALHMQKEGVQSVVKIVKR